MKLMMMMFNIFWKAMLNLSQMMDKASQEAEKEGDEEEPLRGLDIKTLRECLGGIEFEKALETLKKCDPNPARSSKVAHDVEKSVISEIYDEKTRKTNCPPTTRSSSQSDMLSLSHLPTPLQLALPHPLRTVLQLQILFLQTSEMCRPCYS
ncbi:hypothetical protein E2C01_096348 [Portunus trituberculatus]|uniref:Uncharacterized protein n=1 Tax=Portunus trituberculatus TaxID=210409 RepID=A0A5B7K1T0_PORTR|nr:hypothetical protein [Portunus trituberculatus]